MTNRPVRAAGLPRPGAQDRPELRLRFGRPPVPEREDHQEAHRRDRVRRHTTTALAAVTSRGGCRVNRLGGPRRHAVGDELPIRRSSGLRSHSKVIIGPLERGSSHHKSTHRIWEWFVRQPPGEAVVPHPGMEAVVFAESVLTLARDELGAPAPRSRDARSVRAMRKRAESQSGRLVIVRGETMSLGRGHARIQRSPTRRCPGEETGCASCATPRSASARYTGFRV
jgi:hypothetical protein